MRKQTILVVDDEPTIREVVRKYLERDGYEVVELGDGRQALDYLKQNRPSLIVLDVMLPTLDGLSLLQVLRDPDQRHQFTWDQEVPIILLTARREEMQRISGLKLGADDYVTKPFSPQELTARVGAVLRRSAPPISTERPLDINGIMIDPRTRHVNVQKRAVELTAKEFDLLYFLARHPQQVFTRSQLLDQIWGKDFFGDESTVTVHIRRLREKIELDPSKPSYVQTIWGVGYRFEGTL